MGKILNSFDEVLKVIEDEQKKHPYIFLTYEITDAVYTQSYILNMSNNDNCLCFDIRDNLATRLIKKNIFTLSIKPTSLFILKYYIYNPTAIRLLKLKEIIS